MNKIFLTGERFILQVFNNPNQQLLGWSQMARYFDAKDPDWESKGELSELESFTRPEIIDILGKELGEGVSISGDTITVDSQQQDLRFLSDIFSDYPELGIDMFYTDDELLIYYNDRMMTLDDFKLYAMIEAGEGISTFYVGSIFEYYE